LIEKNGLDALQPFLSETELTIARDAAEKGLQVACLPRIDGIVWLRILKNRTVDADYLEDLRQKGSKMLPLLKQYKVKNIAVHAPQVEAAKAYAFAEGLALTAYVFGKYFTDVSKKELPLDSITVSGPGFSAESIDELNGLVSAVCFARDMVNEPQIFLNSVQFAKEIEQAGERFGFSVDLLEKEKIESLKMGGLLAVNKASAFPPRFAILEWKPEQAKNTAPVILVGKGVVYDTGGLSLKSPEGMELMKCDMGGAAAVVGAMAALSVNKLPLHVIGLIPITDNAVNERAVAPGDIITMYSGTTVEVVNTDAEGRLILADALHYAKKYKPELVIDLATLTGAAVRALGNQAICYMGTADKEIKNQFEQAGMDTYERLVEFPLFREYGEELKSNTADLKNLGSGNAGMITAAKFLEHFTDYPWLHLDIAGVAFLRQAKTYRPKEGTGVGVRLLYHFLKNNY
jgi:leucyl aminopeptidase